MVGLEFQNHLVLNFFWSGEESDQVQGEGISNLEFLYWAV
jgi:hypothetical protein